jgi:hypothetical protein
MRRTVFTSLLVSASLGFATACTRQAPAPPPPPYKATVPLAELMHHMMMPAANEIWNRFGVIITAKETIERSPKTEEDWVAMENGAVALTEIPNLLMTPPYAKDNDEWMKAAVVMRDMGERVLKAVQSKDKAKVEEVAGEIDATCDVCHDKYPAAEVPASAEGAKPAEVPK